MQSTCTAGRQMATLDVAKLLLLTNQSKLTLTVALTLTHTVMQKK